MTTRSLSTIVVGPDGCTSDADGQVWVADGFHGRVVRVAPGAGIVKGSFIKDNFE